MKVLELKGHKSLRALNGFSALMLGMKMLPMHMHETYDVFLDRFDTLAETEQEQLLRQAVSFVELTKEETEAIVSFCTDANGVPYSPINIKNMNPAQLVDCIVAVCMEIGRIKPDLVTEDEKKNFVTSVLTQEPISPSTQLSI